MGISSTVLSWHCHLVTYPPLFLPTGSSYCTPIHQPVPNCGLPTYRTAPRRAPPPPFTDTSQRSPTLIVLAFSSPSTSSASACTTNTSMSHTNTHAHTHGRTDRHRYQHTHAHTCARRCTSMTTPLKLPIGMSVVQPHCPIRIGSRIGMCARLRGLRTE